MAFNLENYEDVDTRIHKFWDAHPDGRIVTDITHLGTSTEGRVVQVIITAQIFGHLDELVPTATGIAEETLGSSPVNKTSFIENCETSAIGRALANAGFSTKGSRPSQQEMSKVTRSKEKDEGWPPVTGSGSITIEDDGYYLGKDGKRYKKGSVLNPGQPASEAQLRALQGILKRWNKNWTDTEKLDHLSVYLSRPITSNADVTKGEASKLIDELQAELAQLGGDDS